MMCWVEMENIVKVVQVLTTGTGCQYIVHGKDNQTDAGKLKKQMVGRRFAHLHA
jgi:hypothetical protein